MDYFKKINDMYGHFSGDLVLQKFASCIREELRNDDIFGRFGGEEFTVFLPGADEMMAMEIAQRLRAAAQKAAVTVNTGQVVRYTISIGCVTVIPQEGTLIDTIYKLSDEALYRAKQNGRNRIETHRM